MRCILVTCLLLAACSKGPEADLPSISEARSLGAEWALVNEQAAKGRLTGVFVQTMHKQLREQLQATSTSLTQQDSSYGEEIRALLSEPTDAPPEELRARAARLKQIEGNLESA